MFRKKRWVNREKNEITTK